MDQMWNSVTGVYFHHTTDPQHPAIKDWNVKVFKVRPINLDHKQCLPYKLLTLLFSNPD